MIRIRLGPTFAPESASVLSRGIEPFVGGPPSPPHQCAGMSLIVVGRDAVDVPRIAAYGHCERLARGQQAASTRQPTS